MGKHHKNRLVAKGMPSASSVFKELEDRVAAAASDGNLVEERMARHQLAARR